MWCQPKNLNQPQYLAVCASVVPFLAKNGVSPTRKRKPAAVQITSDPSHISIVDKSSKFHLDIEQELWKLTALQDGWSWWLGPLYFLWSVSCSGFAEWSLLQLFPHGTYTQGRLVYPPFELWKQVSLELVSVKTTFLLVFTSANTAVNAPVLHVGQWGRSTSAVTASAAVFRRVLAVYWSFIHFSAVVSQRGDVRLGYLASSGALHRWYPSRGP